MSEDLLRTFDPRWNVMSVGHRKAIVKTEELLDAASDVASTTSESYLIVDGDATCCTLQ